MAAGFPPPGPRQLDDPAVVARLRRLAGSQGSHPVKGPGEWLFDAAAAWYNAMHAAARADGVTLVAVSGHRTYDEQAALRAAYDAGTGNLAARPGTSRHEYGQAVDVETGGCSDRAVIDWLRGNADRFNFAETVPSECWHWQFMLGPADYPPEVIPVLRLPKVPPNIYDRSDPKHGTPGPRMHGAEVSAAQRILVDVFDADLTYLGGPPYGIDGVWGPAAGAALGTVQALLGEPVDEVWGSDTNLAVGAWMADHAAPPSPPAEGPPGGDVQLRRRLRRERQAHAATREELAAAEAKLDAMAKAARAAWQVYTRP